MKKALKALFFTFFFWLAAGVYFTNRLMYMKKKDEQFIIQREMEAGRYNPDEFEALPKRDVEIPSVFGYPIKALLVEPYENNRYVIIAHGVTETKINSIKYANLFLDRGFNTVIYDHRRHGESGGKTTSFGHYEKFDLKAVVDWLKNEKEQDLLLGIHGESMGAATMLLYAGLLDDGADFYVADCPFSDFKQQLAYLIKKDFKIKPGLLLPIGDAILRLRDRYSIHHVSPISVINNIKHPVLFIHSRKDDFILPSMTKELFEHKRGPKMLYIAENGRHAQSFNENREDYERIIDKFLDKYINQTSTI